ncbi:reticulon-4 receptor-like [Denticeps clupeoides]|uniref:LRRNT domain-containing protein n=1 Tax=Denticeps clupeoides TaxID=299321 RepID=A0AAY4B359_9TELE|nr:reticulon-4 receptor-like [Denticeps clupeoides]
MKTRRPATMTRSARGASGTLTLVLWLLSVAGAEGCPAKCVCFNEPRLSLACQQRGLHSIPADIPVHVQRIFLQGNKLTEVRSTTFSLCRNLTVLWLYSNDINHIEAGAFFGLERLEELDIGDNADLRIISPTAFSGLSQLRTLHLHRCGLSELPYGVFRGLASLQYLYLQDNNLRAIHDDTFLDLAGLAFLYLHNNKIRTVSDHMLRGLLSLDRLLLHQNRVSSVQPRAFHDLRKLTTLFLFYNNLTVLTGETMEPLVSLQYLRLNGNQWICDCRARTLWDWFKKFKGSSSELECHEPQSLFGEDLKSLASADLEGCHDGHQHTWIRVFSTKGRYGKLFSTENPLRAGIPKCCLTNTNNSSIILDKSSSYNSQQITKNPTKESENMAKTKVQEFGTLKNSSHGQNLGQGPEFAGTLSSKPHQPKHRRDFAEGLVPTDAPLERRCLQRPDGHCVSNGGSAVRTGLFGTYCAARSLDVLFTVLICRNLL